MKFVEVKTAPRTRKRGSNTVALAEMLQSFLKTGMLAAEVVEFDKAYVGATSAYQSLRSFVRQYFPSEIRVSRAGSRIFITNLKEEAK